MTWDVYAVRAPGQVKRLEDMPDHYRPRLLGQADDVVETVRGVAPHVDATDPAWLVLDAPDHHVEVSLGKGAQVHSVTFYIGSGDGAVPVVLDICRQLNVTPFETESGEILSASSQPPSLAPPDDDEDADGPKRRWWRRGGGS